MNVQIDPTWKEHLQPEFEQPYFQKLTEFVREEYRQHTVYPPGRLIFNAFNHCTFDQTRVVILGQDPYHGPNQANGLAFSVSDSVPKPPSLLNIFKEVRNETGQEIPQSGNLERWADQGVLLLNSILTVRARTAGSHKNKGWELFTDAVIRTVAQQKERCVFILWGAYAQKKGQFVDADKHLVLTSAHPSPFAADRGFFGNGHFVRANEYLRAHGQPEIEW
ncbi:MAG: uracil-DNA glycosylase [Catalinimonas sp.]